MKKNSKNITPQNFSNVKKILYGIIILYFLLVLVYLIVLSISSNREINKIDKRYGRINIIQDLVDEKTVSDSVFLKLLKDKAYYQSRISLADSDSLYLLINFHDSTLRLEIMGVEVHRAKISKWLLSNVIKKASAYAVISMFSFPLTVNDEYSTIKKEPLMIKMAPKDTSEYKPDAIPDTAVVEPVNIILEMDNEVRLFIYQKENERKEDRMSRFYFDLNDKIKTSKTTLFSILSFSIPDYHPFIKIEVPKSDARIIYRALPIHAKVAIYL